MYNTLSKYIWLALAFAGAFFITACALSTGPAAESYRVSKKAVGYVYEIGALKGYDLTTPPYIPSKIRFLLNGELQQKGLLAGSESNDNRLRVDVEIRAVYPSGMFNPGGASSEQYNELISSIQVADLRTGEIIATHRLSSVNGFGRDTSDFTERAHAKEIGDFLESIVI